jgi:hypothetical protein
MHTISDLITREREAIMARWLEQARHAASARRLDRPALIDLMPRYLASLSAGEDGGELVDRHVAARLRQGFQLTEIVDEFALNRHGISAWTISCAVRRMHESGEYDSTPRAGGR